MIALTDQQGTIGITKNEFEILQTLRQMKANDKIVIQKLRPNNRIELFVRVERGIFMEREPQKGFLGGQKYSRME